MKNKTRKDSVTDFLSAIHTPWVVTLNQKRGKARRDKLKAKEESGVQCRQHQKDPTKN